LRPGTRAALLTILIATIGALAFGADPARAWTYGDTLTVIWNPLPSLPALARPGDTFTIWANAPSTAAGWSAGLRFGALEVALEPAGGGYVASKLRWELLYRVPDGTPEEVYDLWLSSDSTVPDTSRHAVKVLTAFKNDFYFAQISDTHLPTHALSSGGVIDVADTSGMADFDAVIDDLNLIHPEFILHSGDLVNEGELEEYLAMFEMGRAKAMLSRLEDPIFVSSGNHDQGGWQATLPPDGTSKKNWWRHFGWPYLGSPPPGEPYHSQDFAFDYGLLHVIGLEAYINNGSYDHYLPAIWGAQSFTAEQMGWLSANLAAVPAGHAKLLFYHYDFGGTLANGSPGANFSQINPAALGIDGAIWGHNHGVAEGNRAAHPFNLGLQAVIDGRRTFRIFHVVGNQITPGPMHHSGGPGTSAADSLSASWSAPNDGSARSLSATVTNRFGEAWNSARCIFHLADHDSDFVATGGTIAQVLREGGRAHVYVNVALPAGGTSQVSVAPVTPVAAVGSAPLGGVEFAPPAPNPWRAGAPAQFAIRLPAPRRVALAVYDVSGRRVASLFDGWLGGGAHRLSWGGLGDDGAPAKAGLYLVRLSGEGISITRRLALTR